ncbi:ATP-dependent DNA helicase Rep [Mariprofundus erugo]|uniref:DNA 3'-5' helicase n=1 Tax=Mariprofundus erugo TaxID=2528639 RepID=A0A5R9GQV0_9PROT|nr:UvrD-helicase domain-containing protein [Mariprofundus erugo]TLS66773.1 ATP-dependent DNA helicase Rep [Mariprofundus erugo]TLS78372.1 ATP-dependent DNA helicase Rep [Mariprofundus erugo]
MANSTTSGLNDAQYQAVFHRKGPLLVLAGAGSGKTRVITERIAALVERDVPEHAITAVTFTNKAAKEMRERLHQRLGDRAKGLRICTFHALGLAMVREHAELVGRKANVSVFAGSEQKTVMRSVLTELKLAADTDQVDRMVARISALKSGLVEVHENKLAMIRDSYDALLEKMNAVDFDDLLVLPVRLLSDHAEVRAIWRERARHFLVDEYQDSSRLQYQLVRLLVAENGNLTVVGDDDQSIYGWRGAEVKNLFQLERDYTDLTVIRLEENYRSTGSILKASNTLIARNAERLGKTLRSSLGPGKPVRVWENADSDEEARRVAGDIRSHHASSNSQWDGYCVLYRASFQARSVELAMREAGIPYHVSGGLSFFDRAEIQDTLAYLRLISNFNDDLAFMRAVARPRRGIGSKALGDLGFFAMAEGCSLLEACLHEGLDHKRGEALREFGDMIVGLEHQFKHGEPDEAFDAVLDITRLEAAIRAEADDAEIAERRMGNVLELRRWWMIHSERGGNLDEFLQHIFLLAEKQDDDPSGQVRLMTVHAAKGLEFDNVYVIGMEEGIFPHRNALDENRMEEERRLMYVAMTRARFRLTLSYARSRKRFGTTEKSSPSPFLKEPDQSVLRWVDKEVDSEEAKEEAADHMAAMRKILGLG